MRRRELWLGRHLGAWAWLLHRLSGVVLAFYLVAHIMTISYSRLEGGAAFDRAMQSFNTPVIKLLELALIATVVFHGANGFRILMLDFVLGIHHQRALFWAVTAVGAAIFLAAAVTLLPLALSGATK